MALEIVQFDLVLTKGSLNQRVDLLLQSLRVVAMRAAASVNDKTFSILLLYNEPWSHPTCIHTVRSFSAFAP